MATTFYLVRHATHGLLNRILAGRMAGVSLSPVGKREADRLADHFASREIVAVQSGPLERARETARPIAGRAGLRCEAVHALDEVDIGEWTGRSFEELKRNPAWRIWNSDRGHARAPGGETMAEVQARLLAHLRHCCASYPEGRVVLVSHAETIRSALLHFLGGSLDDYSGIEISPAGVSTIIVGNGGGEVVRINERVAL